jgi:hypothetical protein
MMFEGKRSWELGIVLILHDRWRPPPPSVGRGHNEGDAFAIC